MPENNSTNRARIGQLRHRALAFFRKHTRLIGTAGFCTISGVCIPISVINPLLGIALAAVGTVFLTGMMKMYGSFLYSDKHEGSDEPAVELNRLSSSASSFPVDPSTSNEPDDSPELTGVEVYMTEGLTRNS